ncbi:NAD-dependent epimerase [Aeromicrobium sp. PE09-221]|uniref:NAD(P)-dependent oxidoreductase n=1 Tax=Aeromicrobium sp. PE09-221 TaxID=1898043 RepID=UPI000B3EBF64|nr:NAD(P)H-binding protein [Aeromicrobium sp. PE09-221]OUZ09248.1 NAD-dependent epimerase [Aeromicrobium sp. PE09-221]
MAHVLVFGVTGYAGRHITAELLSRGHHVTGIARDVSSVDDRVTARAGSIFDADLVRDAARGVDEIVVALPARALEEDGPRLIDALPTLVATATAEKARLSFVGGAGSLDVSEGGPRLFDTPDFPADYRTEATEHGAILDALRETDDDLDWFYVSPAASFGAWNPGERTGEFRIGGDVLLTDANGDSSISGADYAIAYVDEIENPRHRRARFSVAY